MAKSPFPGMDPYLERHWEDVHTALIGYVRDALQPQLAEDLIARMEEKVYVEENEGDRHIRRPDVLVVEAPTGWPPASGEEASTLVLDEPLVLEPVGDPLRERSVLIYDSAGNRLVTAIEILSPWNKSPGKAVEKYLEKRSKYVDADVTLVEIDLIRTGDWTGMIGNYRVPDRSLTTYRVTVVPADKIRVLHYPIRLSAKLPTIKIPLRPHDTPARLDLQALIEKAYAMGRYDRIDYSRPCSPPFTPEEQAWVTERLRATERA